MAKNGKVAEVVEVEAVNADGEEKATELLAPLAEIPTREYDQFLATAQNLATYKATISIASKYYEFTKQGESVRGVFLGLTEILKRSDSGDLQKLECVQWLAADGSIYLNGGAALLSTFRQFVPPKGCPIEIIYEGKKGHCKIYDVKILA